MNKSFLKSVLFFAVLSLAITGCTGGFNGVNGSGKIVSETRDVKSFSKIELNGQGLLLLKQADTESLEINTDDNLLEFITTEVRGDTLVIESKKNLDPTIDIRYSLTFATLESIELNGSGDIRCSELTEDSISLLIKGSGDMNLGIDVKELKVIVRGSGDIYLRGSADNQVISIAGSGDYRAKELSSRSAKISIAGSGDAVLDAADTLDISIMGSGNISYTGSPKITQSIAGSGKIAQYSE